MRGKTKREGRSEAWKAQKWDDQPPGTLNCCLLPLHMGQAQGWQERPMGQAIKCPGYHQVHLHQGIWTLQCHTHSVNSRFSWAQTSYLSKQILQGAGVKERSCIWNFFFLIAIFLLLRRMSPYWLLIIIGPMPVGKIEPGRQENVNCGKEDLEMCGKVVLVLLSIINARG